MSLATTWWRKQADKQAAHELAVPQTAPTAAVGTRRRALNGNPARSLKDGPNTYSRRASGHPLIRALGLSWETRRSAYSSSNRPRRLLRRYRPFNRSLTTPG